LYDQKRNYNSQYKSELVRGGSIVSKSIIWFEQPAKEWNEALPIGNGRLGAMVYGKISMEQIQLNEESVWYGGPRDLNNPDALSSISKMRELLLNGKRKVIQCTDINEGIIPFDTVQDGVYTLVCEPIRV
jgi:hypothetical protein